MGCMDMHGTTTCMYVCHVYVRLAGAERVFRFAVAFETLLFYFIERKQESASGRTPCHLEGSSAIEDSCRRETRETRLNMEKPHVQSAYAFPGESEALSFELSTFLIADL